MMVLQFLNKLLAYFGLVLVKETYLAQLNQNDVMRAATIKEWQKDLDGFKAGYYWAVHNGWSPPRRER